MHPTVRVNWLILHVAHSKFLRPRAEGGGSLGLSPQGSASMCCRRSRTMPADAILAKWRCICADVLAIVLATVLATCNSHTSHTSPHGVGGCPL